MNEIEIVLEDSNIFGYCGSLSNEESFLYFSAFFKEEDLNNMRIWLKTHKITEFYVLRNIYVDEKNRNQGTGKRLVSLFIKESQGNPILLLASPDEEGFDLVSWYEKQGFILSPFACEDGPLMIKI